MLVSGAGAATDGRKRRSKHVLVCGNEKRGSGKSTIAMHVAVALLKSGYGVAIVDLDERRLSSIRYVENRERWSRTQQVG